MDRRICLFAYKDQVLLDARRLLETDTWPGDVVSVTKVEDVPLGQSLFGDPPYVWLHLETLKQADADMLVRLVQMEEGALHLVVTTTSVNKRAKDLGFALGKLGAEVVIGQDKAYSQVEEEHKLVESFVRSFDSLSSDVTRTIIDCAGGQLSQAIACIRTMRQDNVDFSTLTVQDVARYIEKQFEVEPVWKCTSLLFSERAHLATKKWKEMQGTPPRWLLRHLLEDLLRLSMYLAEPLEWNQTAEGLGLNKKAAMAIQMRAKWIDKRCNGQGLVYCRQAMAVVKETLFACPLSPSSDLSDHFLTMQVLHRLAQLR